MKKDGEGKGDVGIKVSVGTEELYDLPNVEGKLMEDVKSFERGKGDRGESILHLPIKLKYIEIP